MSRQNLTLLEFPKTQDELVQNRINGLLDAMCTTDTDFVPDVLTMLVSYIEENFNNFWVIVERSNLHSKRWLVTQ